MRIAAILCASLAVNLVAPTFASKFSPSLTKKGSKKGKDKPEKHAFPVSWSFTIDHDVDPTAALVKLMEEDFVISANGVHDLDQFRVTGTQIDKITQTRITELSHVNNKGIRGGALGEIDPWRRYLIWNDGMFHYACRHCYYYDDDAFLGGDAFVEAAKKSEKEWEEALCGMLQRTDTFKHAGNCEVVIDYDHELPNDELEYVADGVSMAVGVE